VMVMLPVIVALQALLVAVTLGWVGVVVLLVSIPPLWLLYRSASLDEGLFPIPGDMEWLPRSISLLAKKAGLESPRLYLKDEYIPNAYSFGNTIVLSLGLFEVLDESEVVAVAAHELGHIKNRDTLWFPLVTYGRFLMAEFAVLLLVLGDHYTRLVVPLLYVAYELARSDFMKKREFLADETALRLLDTPMSLKKALEELKYYEDLRTKVKVSAVPSIEPGIEREKRFIHLLHRDTSKLRGENPEDNG